ncbi:hypothetical protein [Pedomonas mirosovicensis]|uniref:hypothetical protein n=1 Tax=Pedomonas mirosovicensis TaxID=2908641 RepID=UPI002168EDF5|nr:hypothetical protein [Pedomonas mirosovicensis]MCH8685995.1 hypothetical protein [Pedomonas mirosovicensis]
MQKILMLMLAGLALAGCASGAKPGAMVVPVNEARLVTEQSPLFQSMQVQEVSGGQKTNPMWTSEVSNEAFAEALRQTLSAHALLAAEDGKYVLKAQLVELKQPVFGFTFTVKARVRYTLAKADGSETLLDEEVASEFSATTGDAFLGVERLRLANEGAIRTSIENFLNLLLERAKTDPRFQPVAQSIAMQIREQLLG